MWKVVLAFAVGVAAGWFGRPTVSPTTVVESAPPAVRAHNDSPRRERSTESESETPPPTNARVGVTWRTPGTRTRPHASPEADVAKTDAEVLALLNSEDGESRGLGACLAGKRGLLTFEQLLERARTDRAFEGGGAALATALELAAGDDARMDEASREVLAWARSDDPVKRRFGLAQLDDIGARGAALGRELLDQGGLNAQVYFGAVSTQVAAHRFERLVPEGIDARSFDHLLDVLQATLDDDESIAPHVAAVLREAGCPREGASMDKYCSLAIQARAPEIVRDLARSSEVPSPARLGAIRTLLHASSENGAAVTLVGEILSDRSTPAATRRFLLDGLGSDLGARGPAGVAVLRRVADHDESPWIRELGAELLADVEDR